eukprot:2920445-Prymnesium_polylepis.1
MRISDDKDGSRRSCMRSCGRFAGWRQAILNPATLFPFAPFRMQKAAVDAIVFITGLLPEVLH